MYYIANIEDEDAADFPYIEDHVWVKLRKIYADINDQCVRHKTAEVLLSLLQGEPLPEIGFFGHGHEGWSNRGRILECVDIIDHVHGWKQPTD